MTLLTCSLIWVISVYLEEQRLRLHHLLQPRGCGQGPLCALALPGRQEDRPQARHSKVDEPSKQNEEDFRWRSQPRNLSGWGQSLLQSVRWVQCEVWSMRCFALEGYLLSIITFNIQTTIATLQFPPSRHSFPSNTVKWSREGGQLVGNITTFPTPPR